MNKLQKNMFIASDECVSWWGRTLLALESNAFHAGDEHFSAGDARVKNARSSYQGLSSRIYVEMIAIVPNTYLQKRRYHIEEIQKVSRCTTTPSVALNWSSRPSK